ncbi:nuclear factor interleukin-3-regulated protein-like [Ruditapes philippinarum]|uniref:nuclear factor interleukin-3-regulated protein-like n=1 Tax=Ruditapes philippinarum TaxID=129788 RepID=UPI00295BB5BA|nr:nuclear factor interleukin-3-regulated protein-like [Ruditapes philippinarum]
MNRNVLSAHIPISQQRRAKQLVPDTQKDNSYWQKRQRNNLAAKKSRENKRQYECMVRARVVALEEENCLLKRELDLLKERFNIPKDASILSSSDREECLHQCKRTLSFLESSNNQRDTSNFDTSDYSDCSSNSMNDNSRAESLAESAYTPMEDAVVWAVTPAHSQSLERYAESSRIYRNELNDKESGDKNGPFYGNKRKRTMFNDNTVPADLSMKRNYSTESSALKYEADDKKIIDRRNNNLSTEGQMSSYGKSDISDDPIDLTKCGNELYNSDIKCKLQILSDQVERMQKLVCNS